jgi:uncharacterized protein YbjT (DUF2867 family)
MVKSVVVAGATGLVGREIIKLLDQRPEVEFTALVRREGTLLGEAGRVKEVRFDFDDPASYQKIGTEIRCDVLLCALGTTLKTAGSQEAFRKVDFLYPKRLMEQAAQLEPKPTLGIVSSAGAGHPKGFYLQTKADMEKALVDSGLPHVIVRPSLLLGDRDEFRLGERMATVLLAKPYLGLIKIVAPQSRWLWKYAPIYASQVAAALVRTCVDDPPRTTGKVLQGLMLHHPILDLS